MAAPQRTLVSSSSSLKNEQVKHSSQTSSTFTSYFSREIPNENICNEKYSGSGTTSDPYIIDYLQDDSHDALNFSSSRKTTIAVFQSLSTFVVTFASSAYTGGIEGVEQRFNVSEEVATLGLSLFVLGFALGPLLWAPLSELYGRKLIYIITFASFTAFSVGSIFSPNIQSLLILRFIASAFGSSTLTNTGGVIADMLSKEKRGAAMGLFVTAPFLGPALGPVAGNYLGEAQGWRWVLALIAIMAGVVLIASTLTTRETYSPVILRGRASHLSKITGKVYVSRLDAGKPLKTVTQELSVALSRPWVLLFLEPIVLLMSLYMSIVYGTLYMLFAAIPIVFEGSRGWNQGTAGLPFVGVAVGVCLATVLAGVDSKRYARIAAGLAAKGVIIDPEARLSTAMIGSVILPIGLFLFAWTTYPSVHWIAPILGALIFACGLVLVFISQMSYLMDSYTVYSASVLAAGSLLRSLFGAAFPLFTTQMYANLGDQWASSIPAFLALACVPIPFLFYRYGPSIRSKCKFASEAARVLELMTQRHGAAGAVDILSKTKTNVEGIV